MKVTRTRNTRAIQKCLFQHLRSMRKYKGVRFSQENMNNEIKALIDSNRGNGDNRRYWHDDIPGLVNILRGSLDRVRLAHAPKCRRDWVGQFWEEVDNEEYEEWDTSITSDDEADNESPPSSSFGTSYKSKSVRKSSRKTKKQSKSTHSRSRSSPPSPTYSSDDGDDDNLCYHSEGENEEDYYNRQDSARKDLLSRFTNGTPSNTSRKLQKSTQKFNASARKKISFSGEGTSHQSLGGVSDTYEEPQPLMTFEDIMSGKVSINDLFEDNLAFGGLIESLKSGSNQPWIVSLLSRVYQQQMMNNELRKTIHDEEVRYNSEILEAEGYLSSLTSDSEEVTKRLGSHESGVFALRAEMEQGSSSLNSLQKLKSVLDEHAKYESDLNQRLEGNDDSLMSQIVQARRAAFDNINRELSILQEEEQRIYQGALGQILDFTKQLKGLEADIADAKRELVRATTSKERAVTTAWAQVSLMRLIVDCVRSAQAYPTLPQSERAKLDQNVEHCLEMIAMFRREKHLMDRTLTYASGNTLLDSLRSNDALHAPTATVMVPPPRMEGHQSVKPTSQYSVPTPSNQQQMPSQAVFSLHPQAAAQQNQTPSHNTQVGGGVGAVSDQSFVGQGGGDGATTAGGMNAQQTFGQQSFGQVSNQQGSVSQQAYDNSSSLTSASVVAPTSSGVEGHQNQGSKPPPSQYFVPTPSNQQQMPSQAVFSLHPQAAAQQNQTPSHNTQVGGGVGAVSDQSFVGQGGGDGATTAGGMNAQQTFGQQSFGQVSNQQGSVSLTSASVVAPTSSGVEGHQNQGSKPPPSQYSVPTPSNQQQMPSQAVFSLHPQAAAQQNQTPSHNTQVGGGVGAVSDQSFVGQGGGDGATTAGGMNASATAAGGMKPTVFSVPSFSDCSTMGDTTVCSTKTSGLSLFGTQSIMMPSVQSSISAGGYFKSSAQANVDLSSQAGGARLPFSANFSVPPTTKASEEVAPKVEVGVAPANAASVPQAPVNNVTTSAVVEVSSLQQAAMLGSSIGLEGVSMFGAAQQTQDPPANPVTQAPDNTDTQTVQTALTSLTMSSNKN